jgi:short-subunit dehydrogenase
VLLAHAAIPALVERQRGSVVFVTSVAGAMPVPRETVYSMTKAAVEAFAEPLREELRGTGVTVSTVLPGVVATEFFDRRGEPYDRRFPRPLSAERVAETVVRVITRQQERAVTPRWLGAAARFRAVAPGTYRALARRFG